MGRPEQPLDRDGSPAREFAFWLRDLRSRADLTYDQLSRLTKYSTSTLQEATAGRRLPTLKVVQAIVEACGGDEGAWRLYWAQLKRMTDRDPSVDAELGVAPPWAKPVPDDNPDSAAAGDLSDADAPPVGAGTSKSPGNAEIPDESRPLGSHRRRYRVAAIAAPILVFTAILATVLIMHSSEMRPVASPILTDSRPSLGQSHSLGTAAEVTFLEEEYNKNGASTFLYLNASGPGLPLEFQELVRVSCKIYNTTVPTTIPDGYWYRIASMPWDNNYYAVANTFLNGDKPGGPYTHNTDFEVPNC